MELYFLFLSLFICAVQFSEQSKAALSGLDLSLDGTADARISDEDRLFVTGMMDKRNEAILKKIRRLNSGGLGTRAGLKVTQDEILFQLYRKKDKESYYTLKPSNDKNLQEAPLDKTLETKVIIHGWMNYGKSRFPIHMKDTLLEARDMNVIVVDWGSYSFGIIYPWTVTYVPDIGDIVGTVVSDLISKNYVNISSLHFMGHSLGAHVSGYAGKKIYKKLGQKVPWITGLDPALPCFTNNPPEKRLASTDGDFVDIIHTCANYLGYVNPIGHVDFYPNGGTTVQPGCGSYDMGTCSHNRAYEYYAEALVTPKTFVGYPCSDVNKYNQGKCKDLEGSKRMGELYDGGSQLGKFFLETNTASPFHIEKDEDEE